ncbi:hypothetical protein MHYP_G00062650 [Metynnis hypsauchen]
MVKLLGPVKAATTVMCEEEQPTVSVIAPLQAKLLDHLKAASEDLTLITEMKETMKRELEQRYVDVQQVLHKASALDPRFKKLPFLREEERDATFQCLIQDGLQRLDQKDDTVTQDEETPPACGQATNEPQVEITEEHVPPSKKLKTLEALFGDVLYTVDPNQMIKTSRDLAQAEVVKYRETASLNLAGNVLEWWKTHQSEFPVLADLAKEYLCIPSTSVPSERVFSTAGDLVRSERSALSPEHVDQLIFLKKNLSKKNTESLSLL